MISRGTSLRRRITTVLVIANLCLLVIYVSGWTNPTAQNNNKKVVRPLTLVKQPVEITIVHRGQPVKENEEFEGDAYWLKNLKFKIKNRSEKALTYVVLDLKRCDNEGESGTHYAISAWNLATCNTGQDRA